MPHSASSKRSPHLELVGPAAADNRADTNRQLEALIAAYFDGTIDAGTYLAQRDALDPDYDSFARYLAATRRQPRHQVHGLLARLARAIGARILNRLRRRDERSHVSSSPNASYRE